MRKVMAGQAWWVRAVALGLVGLLAACAPEYNWRQVAVAEGRVVALFPARPVTETRQLAFEGRELAFSMTQAKVGGDLFAVGYAPWGAGFRDGDGARERLGREVLMSLYRNLGVPSPAHLPLSGEDIVLRGGPGQSLHLRVRIWLTAHGLVEGLVMTQGSEDGESASLFLDTLAKAVGAAGR